MFGDDNGEIAGWKEEGLVPEQTVNSGQGHWAAVATKFRKCVSFCNTVGVPCHCLFTPKRSKIRPFLWEKRLDDPKKLPAGDGHRRCLGRYKIASDSGAGASSA